MKLNASTIVENLIASLIVAIVFSVGLTVYLNIATSGRSEMESKASSLAHVQMNETVLNNHFMDIRITEGEFEIVQTANQFKDDNNLAVIHIMVSKDNNEIYSLKRVLYVK